MGLKFQLQITIGNIYQKTRLTEFKELRKLYEKRLEHLLKRRNQSRGA